MVFDSREILICRKCNTLYFAENFKNFFSSLSYIHTVQYEYFEIIFFQSLLKGPPLEKSIEKIAMDSGLPQPECKIILVLLPVSLIVGKTAVLFNKTYPTTKSARNHRKLDIIAARLV